VLKLVLFDLPHAPAAVSLPFSRVAAAASLASRRTSSPPLAGMPREMTERERRRKRKEETPMTW
jgi:hypothetical protein